MRTGGALIASAALVGAGMSLAVGIGVVDIGAGPEATMLADPVVLDPASGLVAVADPVAVLDREVVPDPAVMLDLAAVAAVDLVVVADRVVVANPADRGLPW
jgi:hypothetical protein